ncbi:hypothetical protein PG985_011509 [Apiospora marii]|uniref:Circumsporozoite protein n=1 Tax=Apiospora marii TaxID=335849 RepID=A0ABR1R1S5_9PEZI
MYTKAAALAILLAVAEARFGQEGAVQNAIQGLSSFGNPGAAGTLAGQTPSVLLAAADPCAKLELADKIVSELGNDPEVIKGAAELVAAEQNFNPFNVKVPNICADASLPATAELRGITSKVDPDVDGADQANRDAETSLTTPFDASGKSVADIMKANGFTNFATKGGAAAGGNAGGNAGNQNNNNSGNNNQNNNGNAATTSATRSSGGATATSTSSAAATSTSAAANNGNNNNNNSGNNNNQNNAGGAASGKGAVTNDVTGNFPGFQESSLGLDFGTCVPTVKFEESLNGRKAGESTFQAQDPAVNKGQNEALNPNIIFTRVCDQLNNVCGAAKDAVAACKAAQKKLGTGPKDATTADAWNAELGFAGVSINPDNAPKAGLVGHT